MAKAGKTSRPRKPRGFGHERIDEILEAAKALHAEGGYAGITTRKIAELVGVSQTALYTYFPDKDAILIAVCDRAFRRLDGLLVAAEAAASREAVFPALLRTYLDFAFSVPVEYEIIFMPPRSDPKGSPTVRPGLFAFHRFRDQVAALMSEGHLRPGDPDTVAQAVWASLHGLATLLIVQTRFPWAGRADLIDTLIDGLVSGYGVGGPGGTRTRTPEGSRF